MRVKRAVWMGALGVYLVFALATGGVCVYSQSWFGGSRSVRLVNGLSANVWIEASYSRWGVPFIGFHCSERVPGPLRIGIYDWPHRYAKILISRVGVRYADGQTKQYVIQWRRTLEPATLEEDTPEGTVATPVKELSDRTPKVVDRSLDLSLTLEGHLETVEGELVPFKVTEDFKHRSSVRFYTVWRMFADMG